ncbi:unnamed protein product [Mytilus edulis]|uniref:COR domain-containing protein n=1 Tax=Mytilus edulis TaxID=6550 RepID=A0A8S3REF9_MYTED|nr:unnamed protein product [Mytilus edulis]
MSSAKRNKQIGEDLLKAAKKGFRNKIERYLKRGANINYQNRNGKTALHLAASVSYGNTDSVQLLIDGGIDLNLQDKDGLTALNHAIDKGNKDILFLLIDNGIDINIQDVSTAKEMKTKSHSCDDVIVAIFNLGNYQSVGYSYGVFHGTWLVKIDVQLLQNTWFKGFMSVEAGRNYQLIMTTGSPPNLGLNGSTVLHHAVHIRNSDMFNLLIDNGFDINLQDNDGSTALHHAVHKRNLEMYDWLIWKGIDMDLQNKDGSTALHLAANCGNSKSVQLLIYHGIEVNLQDNNGKSALHLAALNGNTEIVKFLIDAGIDLNLQEQDGLTALQTASDTGFTDVVRMLIDSGTQINFRNKDGPILLFNAVSKGNTEMVHLLIQKGIDINFPDKNGETVLHHAVLNRKTEIIKMLIEAGIDLNAHGKDGLTALHTATYVRDTDIVHLLIDSGIKINFRNKVGSTALHDAAKGWNSDICHLLIDNGININLKDNAGNTVLHHAAERDELMVKYLLNRNDCNPNILNNEDYEKTLVPGLPVEVKKFDKRSAQVFSSLLEEESYPHFESRVMLVGEQGTGKTTIARYLVGKEATKIRLSTDGIELYNGLSFMDVENHYWFDGPQAFSMEELTVSRSLLQNKTPKERKRMEHDKTQISQTTKDKGNMSLSIGAEEASTNETTHTDIHNRDDSFDVGKRFRSPPTSQSKSSILVDDCKFSDDTYKGIEKKHTRTSFFAGKHWVLCRQLFWDFGGQDVFYSTHQTFLTYRAIYMIVLDGSRRLDDPCPTEQYLPGKSGSKTAKDYLLFWINTIVTYCKGSVEGYPKIMIVLTHKDKFEINEIAQRRNELFSEIKNMFEKTPLKQHLLIDDKIFVNAKNKNDPEMAKIKDIIINETECQPTWGEPLPKCFIPLELECASLIKRNIHLITLEQFQQINSQQPIRPLTESELKVFLKFQHSIGKVLYFDEHKLNDRIILSPTLLIDAFKSIVTDRRFCKGDTEREELWDVMGKTGMVSKKSIQTVWKKKKYLSFYENKDYLLDVMAYLDILVEPRRYNSDNTRIPAEFYYIASMVRAEDDSGYLQSVGFTHRSISIAFQSSSLMIPPALSFRFLSYCLYVWAVKSYGKTNKEMLFHRSGVFIIDPSLDMSITCKDDKIIARLVHATSSTLIMRGLASSIYECLTSALEKISQLYIRTSSDHTQTSDASFTARICCNSSDNPCFLSDNDRDNPDTVWTCPSHGIEHSIFTITAWIAEKNEEECKAGCPVTNEEFLKATPSDLHLRRLSLLYSSFEAQELAIYLGLPNSAVETILETEDPKTSSFEILRQCRNSKVVTFKDIREALEQIEKKSIHTLCKLVKGESIHFDMEPEKWDLVPTAEQIDRLAPLVGKNSLPFQIELGMDFHTWEQISYRQNERALVRLNRDILEEWRFQFCKMHSLKPTLRKIAHAFSNINKNIKIVENTLSDLF